jgi:NAD-dependent deacetylase
MADRRDLELDEGSHVLVLTGAGVSAESGIPTFRDAGGLWEQHCLEDVATPEGFARDPRLVWRFYSERRAAGRRCQPNPGHRALAELERRLGDRFLLVTQNIDGLHRRAGSERLVEIHGQLYRTRCAHCDREPFDDLEGYGDERPPFCERCQAAGRMGMLRPAVVWFGELLEAAHFERIGSFSERARRGRFVFLAAGTSGSVFPASAFVDQARAAGAETWLVNADPADNAASFHHFVQGRSGEVLPRLFGA